MARSQAAQTTSSKISFGSSVETICSLVAVGLSDLCYHRELFPEDAFSEPLALDCLDGFKTRILMTGADHSEKANRLNDWVQVSLYDALKQGYAKKFIFGIASDQDARNLLEEYIFRFEHDSDGNIRCTLRGKKNSKPNVDTARAQVVRLLRSITNVTKTLDKVPGEYWLFCKMEYADDCPEEYEPPHFEPAGDRAVGFFPTKPFAMRLGNVVTPFHTVELGCRSVLDSVDVVPGKGPTTDNISRFETTCCGGWTGNDAASEGVNTGAGSGDENMMQGPVAANTAELFTAPEASSPVLDSRYKPSTSVHVPDRSLLDVVQELTQWVAGRHTVCLVDAFQRFNSVNSGVVERAVGMLVARGVLHRTEGPDSYLVAGGKGGTLTQGAADPDEADVAAQLDELRVRGKPRAVTLPSKAGGIHSVPGSQRTQSVAGGVSTAQKRVLDSQGEGEGEGGVTAWPTTQLSDQGNNAHQRKVSMVEEPIHQTFKKRRNAPPPAQQALPAAAPPQKMRTRAARGGRLNGMRA